VLPLVIEMLTQTDVAAAAQPFVPPCVSVAVPMDVPATEISNVSIDVAEATGTIAKAATATNARPESLRLVIRTTVPLWE
jgi:hypothetical protein